MSQAAGRAKYLLSSPRFLLENAYGLTAALTAVDGCGRRPLGDGASAGRLLPACRRGPAACDVGLIALRGQPPHVALDRHTVRFLRAPRTPTMEPGGRIDNPRPRGQRIMFVIARLPGLTSFGWVDGG